MVHGAMKSKIAFALFTLLLVGFGWLVLHANPGGSFAARNLLPGCLAWLLLGFVLRGHAADPRWWLGWLGFCMPALGLSTYLHLAFLFDWQDLSSRAVTPDLLFRFLPYYVLFAGVIGFAIGWIIGRGIRSTGT